MDVNSTPTDTINPGELIRWRIGKEEFVGYMGSRGPNLSNCITATGESFPVVNADISRR